MIEVKEICFSYGKKNILKNISFKINNGECLGVLGNNGVGKSTLITCLNKIRKPNRGEVFIDNKDVLKMSRTEAAKNVAYVAQKCEGGMVTVFDTVLLGRKPYMKWSLSQQDIDMCDNMLCKMGISDLKLRYINELSGGEIQKVMLARALVQQPKLLLLDEPTSNLDPRNQYEMMQLVQNLAKENGFSVVVVIHDLNLAIRYCDRFLFLKNAEVYSYGGTETMAPEIISSVYNMEVQVARHMGVPIVIPYPCI